jgi:hypothetical protein
MLNACPYECENIQRSSTELCTLAAVPGGARWGSAESFSPRRHSCRISRTSVVGKYYYLNASIYSSAAPGIDLKKNILTSNIYMSLRTTWDSLGQLATQTKPLNGFRPVPSLSARSLKCSHAVSRSHAVTSRCMLTGFFPT